MPIQRAGARNLIDHRFYLGEQILAQGVQSRRTFQRDERHTVAPVDRQVAALAFIGQT